MEAQSGQKKPRKSKIRPTIRDKKPTLREQVCYYDPAWRYEDLPDLAKHILSIETKNPGITVTAMMRLMNYEGDPHRFYDMRKLPLYQRLLNEARKDEFTLIKEMQLEAVKKLRTLLRSPNDNISLEAAKYIFEYTRTIAIKKAIMQLEREEAVLNQKAPIRHVVEFKTTQPLPLLGKTVMTDDGRFVPRDSDEGKTIINAERARTDKATAPTPSPGLPKEPVHLVLKGYQAIEPNKPKPADEDDDDGVTLCGAIKDD